MKDQVPEALKDLVRAIQAVGVLADRGVERRSDTRSRAMNEQERARLRDLLRGMIEAGDTAPLALAALADQVVAFIDQSDWKCAFGVEQWEAGRDVGYDDGYDEGKSDAIARLRKEIATFVREDPDLPIGEMEIELDEILDVAGGSV